MKRLIAIFALAAVIASCVGHERDFVRSLTAPAFADWVLINGKIVTLDPQSSIQEAVAVKDGFIVAVGTDGEMRAWRGPRTREINLGGRTVVPGLGDSHIQATAGCSGWDSALHWESIRSLAVGLQRIASAAKESPRGGWIVVAGGWTPTQFAERRLPTRAELDAAAPNHPVYVQILDQAALLNSTALDVLGIKADTPDPPRGRFERDPETGHLTGYLLGAGAWQPVRERIPRPSLNEVPQSLSHCFRELNRLGLTSVHDVHREPVTFAHRRLLANMALTGELTLRVRFYLVPSEREGDLAEITRILEAMKQLKQNDMFRFAGFGGIPARAVGEHDLLKPDGEEITPPAGETLRQTVRFLAARGLSFRLHATHDRSARQLVGIVEEIEAARGGEAARSRSRYGFENLEGVSPQTIARIAKIGAGATVHSRLLLTGESTLEIWGKERMRDAPPLRAILNAGIPLGAGSDGFQRGNYSPMLGLWWLVTGKTLAGTPLRDPRKNLTREEALRAYTLGNAWLTAEEKTRGSIEVDKLADLAVLNGDYLTIAVDRIPALESLLTMVDGRVVYAAGPFASFERP